jgi:hypothetical protein
MWLRFLDWRSSSGWIERGDRAPDGAQPDLVFFFGMTDALNDSAVGADLGRLFPKAHIVGCSTGTLAVGAHLIEEGASAVAIGFAATDVRVATHALGAASGSFAAGRALGQALAGPRLVGIYVLSDGLAVNGSELVDGIVCEVGPKVGISGGLAGDGGRFQTTLVASDGVPVGGIVAAVGFYGDKIRIAHGSAGGWDMFGPKRRITRSLGNVLFELDGKPALDLYEKYLGEEAESLPASALFYPLNIRDSARPDHDVVRTVLAVDRESRSMTFAGDMPEGWEARLMRSSFDRLIDGADEAAAQARDAPGSAVAGPRLCLLVSCVGRRLVMGQRAGEEIEAVDAALGENVAALGFYSYGEIAPHRRSGVCSLQNQTMTLTILGEAA